MICIYSCAFCAEQVYNVPEDKLVPFELSSRHQGHPVCSICGDLGTYYITKRYYEKYIQEAGL